MLKNIKQANTINYMHTVVLNDYCFICFVINNVSNFQTKCVKNNNNSKFLRYGSSQNFLLYHMC